MEPLTWYLEGPAGAPGKIQRTLLRPLPFVIGRRGDSDLILESQHGSHRHAEFFRRDGILWLRDLGSTNGTSINGVRLDADHRVHDGDIVHFADLEFRLVADVSTPSVLKTQVFSRTDRLRLEELVRKPMAFREMLREDRLRADFQPLVRFADRTIFGYEILGRGELDGRDTHPVDLFFIAEKLHQEVELSDAFRAKGLEMARELPGDPALFINTHPQELRDCDLLLRSLEGLRHGHPDLHLVLEIHEAAVTDIAELKTLRGGLERLEIGLAFDDFGTGQARLLELSEVAPQFLKFDAVMIEGLHRAPRKRREMLERLLRMVTDMEISAVAECVESAGEAEVCAELGFELAQGYYFGRPAPAASFS